MWVCVPVRVPCWVVLNCKLQKHEHNVEGVPQQKTLTRRKLGEHLMFTLTESAFVGPLKAFIYLVDVGRGART